MDKVHRGLECSIFIQGKQGQNMDFPRGSNSKEAACNTRDPGSIPGSGRSLGEGNGSLLQYSCLENSMSRGASWDTVHGVAKSRKQLSN